MNQKELLEAIAREADISVLSAGRCLKALTESVRSALARGEDVRIQGLGTFSVHDSPARRSRNPRTGEAVCAPPSKKVRFRAGKILKDDVQ